MKALRLTAQALANKEAVIRGTSYLRYQEAFRDPDGLGLS